MSRASATPTPEIPELARLRRENEQLLIERRVLELKVQKLQRELWDKKSERLPAEDSRQQKLFAEPEPVKAGPAAPGRPAEGARRERMAKGPKPLDPALPREVIAVPALELKGPDDGVSLWGLWKG